MYPQYSLQSALLHSLVELATLYRRSSKRYDEVIVPALVGVEETYKTPYCTSLCDFINGHKQI